MKNRIIIFIFSIFIAFGLTCGLLYSLNVNLNSDTVVPGLVAMEIFKHGNIQFTYPLDDPYLFTDIYPFYLVPQALSGFNPTVLRLTAFFVFLLVIAVFAYIVYRYTGLVNALIFAALLANVSPEAYSLFILPVYHMGTLLAAGILILLFDYDKIKKASFNRVLAYVLFLALILISDHLIIAMFIIPYIACYLLFYRNKSKKARVEKKDDKSTLKGARASSLMEIKNIDTMIILMVLASAIVWLFKNYEPSFLWQFIYFSPRRLEAYSLYHAFVVNMPTYLLCIAYLVNQGWYNIILNNILNLQIGIINIFMALIFMITISFSCIHRNIKAKYLYLLFLISGVITFLGFIFLNFADGLSAARFLPFTAVSIFATIALAYNDKTERSNLSLLFLAAIIILILSTVPYNIQKVSSLDYQPNKADHEMIDYLRANNLTRAYSDFDNSNVLTYLSNEAVEIRPISVVNSQLKLNKYTWLGSARWYVNGIEADPTFIADKNTIFYDDIRQVFTNSNNTPIKVYDYKNYEIFVMPPP